ncbi:hypothetical protein D3C73_1310680 [compost metagenome]
MTPATSLGVPILAASSTCLPSAETEASSRSFFHSAICRLYASCLALYSATSASLGLISTSPLKPSTITRSPAFTRDSTFLVPTTAGISKERAIIAEWEVRPPIFVVKPLTKLRFSCAVSEGVRSCAMTITSSLISAGLM